MSEKTDPQLSEILDQVKDLNKNIRLQNDKLDVLNELSLPIPLRTLWQWKNVKLSNSIIIDAGKSYDLVNTEKAVGLSKIDIAGFLHNLVLTASSGNLTASLQYHDSSISKSRTITISDTLMNFRLAGYNYLSSGDLQIFDNSSDGIGGSIWSMKLNSSWNYPFRSPFTMTMTNKTNSPITVYSASLAFYFTRPLKLENLDS